MLTAPAPIPTWFGIGGGADRYAEPSTLSELAEALREDPTARILGDGANLLVADEGVAELVLRLRGDLASWTIYADGLVTVGAGANLPKLILETCRRGLAGIETLGGVPATIGGAVVMNAGGKHGEIASVVEAVRGFDRSGTVFELHHNEINFTYRSSGLNGLVIAEADLRLTPGHDPKALRDTLKSIMAEKKKSQPLAASSCGCVFKNPTLAQDLLDIGNAGDRVAAGLLIDRAGCKGMTPTAKTVRVSEVHANFFETGPDASASDVIELIARVRDRVGEAFGVSLQPELVIWERGPR